MYVNELECDGFHSSVDSNPNSICDATENAIIWSNDNSMLLNSDKTVLIDMSLSYSNNFDEGSLVIM